MNRPRPHFRPLIVGLSILVISVLAACGNSSSSRERNTVLVVACADGGVCKIGDVGPGGGIVFVTPQTSGNSRADYYMEAAPLNGFAPWGCATDGKTGRAIGDGKANTLELAKSCQESNAMTAVALTNDLEFNGKDDWFLPSEAELAAMYANKEVFTCSSNGLCSSNFTGDAYWSSSLDAADNPVALNFAEEGSTALAIAAAENIGVRAVRAFSTLPGAPKNVAGTTGEKEITLTWTEPDDNGSSAITSYSVMASSNAGATWQQGAMGPDKRVTGLLDGTTYIFKIAAVNKIGAGEFSLPSRPIRTKVGACAPVSSVVGLNTVLAFTAIGACNWTVPDGVTSLDMFVVGGGAGAGGNNGHGGGGGGASIVSGVAVIPGDQLEATVGQGGTGSTAAPSQDATNGFDSSLLVGASSYLGNGGEAGGSGTDGRPGVGGKASHGFDGGNAGATGISNYFSGAEKSYGSGGLDGGGATNAAPNTGNGGTAGVVAQNGLGGSGGSGVILVRYATKSVDAFPSSFGTPFARYVAGDYQTLDKSRRGWVDSSGSGRHATVISGSPAISTVSGNGAKVSVVTVGGTTTDGVVFPVDVLPKEYTLFHVSRYSGANKERIIDGASGDWYSGFNNGETAVAKHGVSMNTGPAPQHQNWLLSTDQNTLYRANGVQVSTVNTGMKLDGPLTVNNGVRADQKSDWQVAEILVYRGVLTIAQIQQVENYFARAYALNGTDAAGKDLGVLSAKAIKATQKTEESAELTWTKPTDETNLVDYVVEFSKDNLTWVPYEHAASTATRAVISGLDDISTYNFRVTPDYADVTNEQTEIGAESLAIKTASKAPTNVTGVPGDGKVDVSWDEPTSGGNTPISAYIVKYATEADGTYTTFKGQPVTGKPVTVDGLTNGIAYQFTVTAVNGAGPGSESASSSPVTPRTVPDAPTDLRAVADNTAGVDVSWKAPDFNGGAPLRDYVIEYASSSGGFVVFADAVSTSTSVKVTGLTKGVSYSFRVSAKNDAGQGSPSSPVAKATPRTVPSAPSGTTRFTIDGAIEVQWDFVAPANNGGSEIIEYAVEWALSSSPTWTNSGKFDNRVTLIRGLTPGKVYKFRAAAKNSAGTGPYSATVTATPRVPPQSPTNLTFRLNKGSGTRNLSLMWDPPTDTGGTPITDYEVSSCVGAVCEARPGVTPMNSAMPARTPSFAITPGRYTFYVAAVNAAGRQICADEFRCGASVTIDVSD